MSEDEADLDAFARTHLALKLASDAPERVKALNVSFSSLYGDGTIPVLLHENGEDVGLYVEAAPWNRQKEEQCLQWLALLRSSDREDLRIEVHSDEPVPDSVLFYTQQTPRVQFELAGVIHVTWLATEERAAQNAATVRRLAREFLDVTLGEDAASLTAFDDLVGRVFRQEGPDRLIPSTIVLLGSYLGEVLRNRFPGRWLLGSSTADTWVELSGPRGVGKVNPFVRVEKLHGYGLEHSTTEFAQAIERNLFGTP